MNGCVLLAVPRKFIEECVEILSGCGARNLWIISPRLDRALDGEYRSNPRCQIAATAMFDDDAELYADDQSKLQIGEYSYVGRNCIVRTTNASRLSIGKSCEFGHATTLHANIGSRIRMGEGCSIGNGTVVVAGEGSEIVLGDNVALGNNVDVIAANGGKIFIGSHVTIARNSYVGGFPTGGGNIILGNDVIVGAYANIAGGEITIGEKTTFGTHLILRYGKASIGKDCMFSSFIRFLGNHKMYDAAGTPIGQWRPIHIGNHVWAGMGAAIMSGARVEDGSIIGAYALVNKHMEAKTVSVGVPAKTIREGVRWER